MTEAAEAPTTIGMDRLVRVYLKIKQKRDEITAAFKEQDDDLKAQQDKIKQAMLEHCKAFNTNSVNTDAGLIIRTVKQTIWTNDWDAMDEFIVAHGVPQLKEKRLNQTNMKQFLEEHPELHPPGINIDSEYSITVRRPTKK